MFSYVTRATAVAFPAMLLAGLLASGGSPLAADFSPELRDLIGKANAEGKVHTSWSQSSLGGITGARRIETEMNTMFGTKIQVTFAPGRSMAATSAKIRAEHAAGQPATSDVYLGSSPFILPLITRKVLQPYAWTKMLPGRIADAMVEGDGTSVRIATGLGGVTYNTKLVPGGRQPTSLADFLGPEWKGKIASTPYAGSFDILSAKGAWGPEKTEAYVRKLSKNVRSLIRCGEGERISTGEIVALVMDCGGQTAVEWAARGAPIAQMLDPQAANKRQFYLAVPKNAARPNAAALYSVFMMTPEGQKVVWETWYLDSDLFPGSNINKQVVAMEKKGAKFAEGSIAFEAAHPEINELKKTLVKILKSAK